jgi:hypothetical protein
MTKQTLVTEIKSENDLRDDNTIAKFENVADLGDEIKCYDFESTKERGDCYVQGIVRDKGYLFTPYKVYDIKITKRVWKGIDTTVSHLLNEGKTCLVPMETSIDFDGRITKVK